MNFSLYPSLITTLLFVLFTSVHSSPLQHQTQRSAIGAHNLPLQPYDPDEILQTVQQQRHIPIDMLPQRFQRHPGSSRPLSNQIHGTGQHAGMRLVQQDAQLKESNSASSANKRPHGAPQRFCNKFGCDCAPPSNARCCPGYRYDRRANKCKEVF